MTEPEKKLVCKTCGVVATIKPEILFYKNNKTGNYFQPCKKCFSSNMGSYYKKNKKRISLRNKEFHKTHREVLLARMKEYYQTHKETKKKHNKEYYETNKEKLLKKLKLKRRRKDAVQKSSTKESSKKSL